MNVPRLNQWLIAWAQIFDGLVCVCTFTLFRPSVSVELRLWSLMRMAERLDR